MNEETMWAVLLYSCM